MSGELRARVTPAVRRMQRVGTLRVHQRCQNYAHFSAATLEVLHYRMRAVKGRVHAAIRFFHVKSPVDGAPLTGGL